VSQSDYVVSNGTGAAVRSDINGQLAAIVTQNSGATEPTTTYAYMRWADTTAGVMKMRNGANSAWITLYQLDGEWSTIAFENGTAAAPSIYFKDSGTDTGFYSPGANQVGISTGGTARLTIDSNGNVDIDSNTLYVDATNNRVGLGTSSPSQLLEVHGTAAAGGIGINITNEGDAGTSTTPYAFINARLNAIRNGGEIRFGRENVYGDLASADSYMSFYTAVNDVNTERLRITSAGNVGIGVTVPEQLLHLGGNNGIRFGNAGATPKADIAYTASGDEFLDIKIQGTTTGYGNIRFSTGPTPSERARIDSSGRLLIGTSSGLGDARLQVVGNTGGDPGRIDIRRNADNPTSGSEIGTIRFSDLNGASGQYALIQCFADAASTSSGDLPGRLSFSTTADGASSPTEAMRIGSTQEVWINRTTRDSIVGSSCKFQVAGSTGEWATAIRNPGASPYGLAITHDTDSNGTGNEFLQCRGASTNRLLIRSNGGIANYSANNVNLSDINSKKDIAPATGTWDCLKEWEIVNFRYKDQPEDADLNMGVIAQQVAESCPEVITVFQEAKEATETEPAQEERLGVKDQQMMWMAIKALQEAQLRIETLETEVAALKGA